MHRWGFTPAGGFAAAAALYPDAEAVVDERGALTFAELDERTNRLANAFSDAGVLEGDGVGVMARNHRGFVEAIVALSKLGADAMLLNTAFAGPQLTEVVKREKPRAIVYDAEFAELLDKALYRRKGFVAWTRGGRRRLGPDARGADRARRSGDARGARSRGPPDDPHLGHHRHPEGGVARLAGHRRRGGDPLLDPAARAREGAGRAAAVPPVGLRALRRWRC